MFEKVVSGLPYSPALVGQLGFYARRLKKEETTRRLGLVFTALALVVQSFAVFSPPEPANAANANDMIRGGVTGLAQVLSTYDQSARGNGDFKAIMDYNGITRADLERTKPMWINSRQFGTGSGSILSWGRTARFSTSQGEVKHAIPLTNGQISTLYSRPLWRFDSRSSGSNYEVFAGTAANGKWFAIMKNCGNLIVRENPQPIPAGTLLAADCRTIRGYAYDARQRDARVSVYLYFNGPPGKGERIGPIRADQATPSSPAGNGYGFSVPVPEKYLKLGTPVPVYGVMIPLSGWSQPSVQIGSVTIPGNCYTPPTPLANCSAIKARMIERTKYSFTATSSVQNGAKINGYVFTVKDQNGKVVQEKTVSTSAASAESGTIELKQAGRYSVSVTVKTSLGDKTGADCTVTVTVAASEKCPPNPVLGVKDEQCKAEVVSGKEVRNLTQNIANANGTTARQGDRLEYTIYLENVGVMPASVTMEEQLEDVLEYASLQDDGSATFDSQAKVLSWGTVTLQPDEKQVRKFVVQVNQIPATPQGISEPGSYDCVMSNLYGNTVTVRVDCPAVKGVEQTVKELPSTGPTENILFGGGLLMVVTYFYARSRQLGREVRLIRHDFNAGTL